MRIATIASLGVKELWSLIRDPLMLVLIVYMFSWSVYMSGTAMPDSLHHAPIAIVDEDDSVLSRRIASAFYLPHFLDPQMISIAGIDPGMDSGTYTFVLDIPPGFQREVLAGAAPVIQLDIDATRMSQAFTGGNAIQSIVQGEVAGFVQRHRMVAPPATVELALRARFNPTLEQSWFGSLMEMIGSVTMLSIIASGSALIREREHGTLEHLLAMPVTPAEIILAKIWSMGLIIFTGATLSLLIVVNGFIGMPIDGSLTLFLFSTALHLFASCSLGIFLATVTRSMPQFGMLVVLVLLPLNLLSGNATPRENMPLFIQWLMLAAPTTHFIATAQAVLLRGAGVSAVWLHLLALGVIGAVFFVVSLRRFRRSVSP